MAKGTTSDMSLYGKVMTGNRPGWYTIIKTEVRFRSLGRAVRVTHVGCACTLS